MTDSTNQEVLWAVIAAKDAKIEQLEAELQPCAGCGLCELHKMCPAYGTDVYMHQEHPAWGNVNAIFSLKSKAKDIAIEQLTAALAETHKPRECRVCGAMAPRYCSNCRSELSKN